MLRIAHVSDLHIRNAKYHAEYREAFENLYEQLEDLRPDLIVNTGDTAHSKLQISTELVEMIAEHFERASTIAPYLMILGNHDLNLHNLKRVDVISPIARQFPDVTLLKTCDPYDFIPRRGEFGVTFWPFSMTDSENYPTAERIRSYEPDLGGRDRVNIGLFHGSVAGCVTDSDWTMTGTETELGLFDPLDYVLMGDIHRQQFFRNRTIAYAGSLVQQNFGESHDKGFLLWKIESAENHSVRHVPVYSSLKFRTVRATDDLVVPANQTTSRGAYVRVFVPRAVTATEQKALITEVKQQFEAKEVICVLSPEAADQQRRPVMEVADEDLTNVRSLDVQEALLRKFLEDREVPEEVAQQVVDLNKRLLSSVPEEEELARNSHWRLNKIGWSNLFNYGEGNVVDFSTLPGLTGIFGMNGTGKSSIFDVINEGLFDKVTKDVSRNIELINDNRDEARVVVDFSVAGEDYVVERAISRIKYGQKKKDVKEWGRTDVDFYRIEGGERVSLNGQSRPETERAIRRLIGSFEDFCLTTLSAQRSILGIPGGGDIIACKETDRKRILNRALDLDIFDKKVQVAKEHAKYFSSKLKGLDKNEMMSQVEKDMAKISTLSSSKDETQALVDAAREELEELVAARAKLQTEIESIKAPLGRERPPELVFDELSSANSELARVRELIEKHDLAAPAVVLVTPKDPTAEIQELETRIRNLQTSRELVEAHISQGRWKLKVLTEVPCGESFPECKFLLDAFKAKETLPRDEAKAPTIDEALRLAQEQRDALRGREQDWNRYKRGQAQEAAHNAESLRLERRLAEVEKVVLDLGKEHEAAVKYAGQQHLVKLKSELSERLYEMNRRIDKVREGISTGTKTVDFNAREIGKLHERVFTNLSELEKIDKLAAEAHVFELYMEAFGKNGVPKMILARALPMINAEINRILANVVDFTVSLDYDEGDQTMGLYIQYGQYKRRNIALVGGAEQFISSLAIRAAILKISSLPRTNMFIIDEGFGKLDANMIDAVQRMFDYLKSCFDHVLIISHLDSMKDAIDNVIEIGVDRDRYAHVEVF